jgi:hypothetical protein
MHLKPGAAAGPRDIGEQDPLEHEVASLSAIVLGAQALADSREAAAGSTAANQVALARLHWAVTAARSRLDELVDGDQDAAPGARS